LRRRQREQREANFVRVETIHPRELGPAEAARWRAYQIGRPSLQSPYFTPEWTQIIGAMRDDARVCVIDGGAGFFPAQRLSRFAAMGLGAPIADYQGVIGQANLAIEPAALCRALKVGRIDLTHVPNDQSILDGAAAGAEGSWIAETSGCRDLYEAALKLKRAEFVRQTDKKKRKFEREHGALEFRASSTDRTNLEALLSWKNDQLMRSGQPAIWATPWVHGVVAACFDARDSQFGGVMFSLSIDQRMIAAALCLRSARVLHFWLLAHDAQFDAYSPGVHLARWATGWAGDHGLAEVDFGPGDYQFKRQLSTTQRMLAWGSATGGSWSGAVRRAEYSLRAGIERLPQPRLAALPGKAMRRLDLLRALAA
jgi:CelD/BcsL family acetyltransferase involved in cellulose biosynthesis